MLKIKSNTNEFTIIFSEKIGKKINAEKFSIPALSFFQLQRRTFLPFFLSFCFSTLFFLSSFLVSAPSLFLFSPLSFFSVSALLFFCFSVSAPLFLLFFSSVYPRPIFSLAASHLFYLNKSLFSSNLE